MINLAAVERDHVLTAIEQFESVGGQALMAAASVSPTGVVLHHELQTYDGSIIVGLAHGLATGYTPDPVAVSTRSNQVVKALVRCGFDVLAPTQSVRARQRTGQRAAHGQSADRGSPSVAVAERARSICPTCYLALPATGRCDTCQ